MENQQSNSSLKAVIAVLAILLVGSLVYIFKVSSDVENVQTELKTTLTEKETVMKDLQDLKSTYDAAIAENTSMSEELIKERDKVVSLMSDLSKSKGDVASMAKYKTQFIALQANMKSLMAENEGLKKQNTKLTVQRDSTAVVLVASQKTNETLLSQNDDLAKTVEKGARLSIVNLKTSAYIVRTPGLLRSSEKQIETDKASRADRLKISFTIAENQIAKSGDKTYYVQVIDSKNNVLGDKKTQNFGDKTLSYSFATTIKYENKSVVVSENLAGKNFAKGSYFVNVFDKDVLVSKSSFDLK
ncbi:hypothetical protein FFWV33_12495 [Flavobacterium faecale]|uniref:Chromosome partitioning protein ParA n=1 Tax=Flavobacterium faecale TaxID=1355330 RepID=A0A2S1LES3_9FLAO|nr:hypothetical protein [Flavobacterium faecale]AWG22280.1 hypothetical protein FFWV33_12495 [Flavobacterium faecale]